MYIPDNCTPIERMIYFYKERLSNLQIREGKQLLISLPKPQKQLFKRIVNGNGKYTDYKKIK